MKEIHLTQGKVTLVDDADYDWLNQWNWCADKALKTYYAATFKDGKKIRMHRFILGLTDRYTLADHIDRDGLNNQRSNLRPATFSQSNSNMTYKTLTSKYRGVCWDKRYKKWLVTINKNGKHSFLGYFEDEQQAAVVYNQAAIKVHKEFANLNVL